MKNIAVTGFPGGMVRDRLVEIGVTPIDADITNREQFIDVLADLRPRPEVVIHAASLTGVDDCEFDVKRAFEVNVRGTVNVADACNIVGAGMVYLSTCHVYDGKKDISKEIYTERSRPNPKNTYGFSKWQGGVSALTFARSCLIVTISKLYSSKDFGKFLVKPQEREIPDFIWRNFTHVNYFCDLLIKVINHYGFGKMSINLGTLDYTNLYDFYVQMYDALGIDSRLISPRNKRLTDLVFRPENGVLSTNFALMDGFHLSSIKDGIDLVASELLS